MQEKAKHIIKVDGPKDSILLDVYVDKRKVGFISFVTPTEDVPYPYIWGSLEDDNIIGVSYSTHKAVVFLLRSMNIVLT